jgi:hypothetical protein
MRRARSFFAMATAVLVGASCRSEPSPGTKPQPSPEGPPDAPPAESPPTESPACAKAGCSGTMCVAAGEADDVVTTCDYRAEYACYQTARCERQASGACGWTQTAELAACLANPPRP